MLITILDQEYPIRVPEHILDKIGEEGVQRISHYLVLYAQERGCDTRSGIARFMQGVADDPSSIWPEIAIPQSDGQRPFVHPAFQRNVWDHFSLQFLCRNVATLIVTALPAVRNSNPRIRRVTGPHPTL